MKKLMFILFTLGMLLSCQKKQFSNAEKKVKKDVPNFSNVDLKQVFAEKELSTKQVDSLKTIVARYYKETWEFDNLWGGFLIAKGDQIIYENYRGFTKENHQDSITVNTPLHIASASKTLTAMAVLKLVEVGQVNLEDTLDKHLTDFPYPGVTIKSLLSQRSGLTKYEYFTEGFSPINKEFFTNQELYKLLVKHRPPVVRGVDKGFMYNNLNFALLALLIEKKTELSYPEAMQKMIFEPLKMKNTFVFQEKDLKDMPLTFYQRNEKAHPLDRFDLIYGDKNIYTTPRDLLNFSIAMYSDDFLRADIKNQIFQPYSNEKPGVNNYGLGFRMKIFNDDLKLTYHNGWWHGTNSVFVHQLDSKLTVIAIGNKFSRRVYSAMMLSALFEPLPFDAPFGPTREHSIDSLQLKDKDSILIANPE